MMLKLKSYSLPSLVFILMLISAVGPILVLIIYEFIRFHEFIFAKEDPILIIFAISIFFTLAFIGFIINNIVAPIEILVESIINYRCKKIIPNFNNVSLVKEFNYLFSEFNKLTHEIEHYQAGLTQRTAMIAHDIRSPVMVINSMLKRLPEVDEERRQVVQHALDMLKDLAHKVLRMSRGVDGGKYKS